MGQRYPKPPVIEALCEIRLSAETPWDATIPGLFYETIRAVFPRKEQRIVQEIEFSMEPHGLQQRIRSTERMLFYAENRPLLVQVGPRVLAVNALKPYPSWSGFKPYIEKAWQCFQQVVDVKGIERVALRYINRIELSCKPNEIGRFFAFHLDLGPRLPGDRLVHFGLEGVFAFAKLRDRCRVKLFPETNDETKDSTTMALILDIEYFLARPGGVTPDNVVTWIEEAHDRVEEMFEGSITDALRRQFGEEEIR